MACGVGSIHGALVGSVCTCLTGPTNAIITSSGKRSRHYTAGIFSGLLAVAFGLMAPAFTRLMLVAPKAFIMVLAGLAMLRVLQSASIASFKDQLPGDGRRLGASQYRCGVLGAGGRLRRFLVLGTA